MVGWDVGAGRGSSTSNRMAAPMSRQRPALLPELIALPRTRRYPGVMCRNIRTLHNFAPPASEDEVQAAALQYVRKVSGSTHPSKANEAAFDRAVAEIARVTATLLGELVTSAPPKDRAEEAAKARARFSKRYSAA
jgi:hypothetical protein